MSFNCLLWLVVTDSSWPLEVVHSKSKWSRPGLLDLCRGACRGLGVCAQCSRHLLAPCENFRALPQSQLCSLPPGGTHLFKIRPVSGSSWLVADCGMPVYSAALFDVSAQSKPFNFFLQAMRVGLPIVAVGLLLLAGSQHSQRGRSVGGQSTYASVLAASRPK